MVTFPVNTLVNIHLVTGEDVLGSLTDVSHGELVIGKPVVPNLRVTEQGIQVGLLPLRPYLDHMEEVRIPIDKTVYVVECSPKMAQMYREFTSGLILATNADLPRSPFAI